MKVTVKVLCRCFVDNRLLEQDSIASVPESCADLPYFERIEQDTAEDGEQPAPATKRGRRSNASTADK